MCINFTVVIPTYNGVKRVPQVLQRLQHQIGVENLSWEIIVVDNNSTDGTAKLIQEYQATWSHPFPLHYILESQQGVAFARTTAVCAARGEIIGFLDDDNLPASNWVIEAYNFAKNYPQAGAIASQIHGKFEVEPPGNIKPILFYLAITERGSKPQKYEPKRKGFPPAAGLVVRRQVWHENVPPHLLFVGRVGSSMLGSEDAESLFYIHKAGWEIWYNPSQEVEHIIPSWRLERAYLISLLRAVGLARFHLRMLLTDKWKRPFVFLMYIINDTRKVIWYFLRYRTVIATDVVAATEMARLVGTLISPLFICKLKINNFVKNIMVKQNLS